MYSEFLAPCSHLAVSPTGFFAVLGSGICRMRQIYTRFVAFRFRKPAREARDLADLGTYPLTCEQPAIVVYSSSSRSRRKVARSCLSVERSRPITVGPLDDLDVSSLRLRLRSHRRSPLEFLDRDQTSHAAVLIVTTATCTGLFACLSTRCRRVPAQRILSEKPLTDVPA